MAIGSLGILILILIFFIVFLITWVFSGLMRISFELLLIFTSTVTLSIIMTSFVDLSDIYQIIIVSGLPIVLIGYFALRFNQLVKDPYNSLLKNYEDQINNRQFITMESIQSNQYDGEMDTLHKLFWDNTEQLNNLFSITFANEQIIRKTTNEVFSLVNQIKNEIGQNVNEVDEIIQNVLLLDESLQKILEEIKDVNTDLEIKYNQIKISLDNAERISDQTNLIAVNAAIEAAHSGELGENFNIVAESIQQISAKSRVTTNKLIQEVKSFQSITENRLNNVENQTQNVDDLLIQIAELSNDASVFIHSQQSLVEKLNRLTETILDKSEENYTEISKYNI